MLKILPKTAMILLAFLAIFLIEWYTPIHSDDYRYYLLGISPESHFHHYMTWSGRIIADYTRHSSCIHVLNSCIPSAQPFRHWYFVISL